MFRKVDPVDPFLITYLQTINPSIKTGVLLEKGVTGNVKKGKTSNKGTQASPSKPSIVSTYEVLRLVPPHMRIL